MENQVENENQNEVTNVEQTQVTTNESVTTNVGSTPNVTESNTINNDELIDTSDQDISKPNFPLAIICAFLASIIGAILWAFITVSTGYQIGYMAIAIGFIVGYTVKFTGRGNHMALGVIGAVFSLLGCILGNYFSLIGFTSSELHIGFFDTLSMFNPGFILKAMFESFEFMDIVFYGIAVYEGFKFSIFLR